MVPQFLKTMSQSSARHVCFASVLVCALGATEAGAHELGFDQPKNELEDALEPITKRQLPDDIVLAQSADDCGCDDAEDYGDEYVDEHGDEDADDSGDGNGNNQGQGISAEQQARLDAVIEGQVRIIETQEIWRGPWF